MGRTFDDTTPACGGDGGTDGPGAGSARAAVTERVDYDDITPAERSDVIGQLAGLMAGTHAELLSVVAAMVRGHDWVADGSTDPAAWLVAACGLTREHAREWVRVAAALEALPVLRAAFAAGELSWDQVRPATRFATPETDAEVAAEIAGLSSRQVSAMAAARDAITRPEAQDTDRDMSLQLRPTRRQRAVRISGLVPADMGAAIATALARRAEAMGPNPLTGRWDPLPRRMAQALHDLASGANAEAARSNPDLATVVIHADASVVDETIDGNGTIGDLAVPHDGVMRALCDCRVEAHLHGSDGATVGIARAGRRIPGYLRRVVHRRDHTCRFPGCDRQIRQLHHIHHWTAGGPTNADNLVGLCWAHHTLVHEGGWSIVGHPDHQLTFVDRLRQRRWTSRPTPTRPRTRRVLRSALSRRRGRGRPSPTRDGGP